MASPSRLGSRSRAWVLVGIGLVAAVAAFVLMGKSGGDDSYITDWVARQLARTGSIANYNGDAIEQSTSLLHVLLIGLFAFITRLPAPLVGYLIGIASLVATVTGAGLVAERIRQSSALIASLVVASAYPFLYWATAGLETLLVTALLLAYVIAYERLTSHESPSRRRLGATVILATAVAAVRPDIMVLVCVLSGAMWIVALFGRRPSVARLVPDLAPHRAWMMMLCTGTGAAIVETFRLVRFGEVVPQSVKAKTGLHPTVGPGWKYITLNMPPWWMSVPVAVLALVGIVWVLRTRSLAGWLVIGIGKLCTVLVVLSGGDWMGVGRLLVPMFLSMAILAAVGAADLARRFSKRHAVTSALLAGAVLVPTWVTLRTFIVAPKDVTKVTASFSPIWDRWMMVETVDYGEAILDVPAGTPWYESRNAAHLRDAEFLRRVEPLLQNLRRRRPASAGPITIASYQAGMVPYYLLSRYPGQFRFIDMYSLSTKFFARCKGVEHNMFGMDMKYASYIAHAGKCAPPLPDVFFSLRAFPDDLKGYYTPVVDMSLRVLRHDGKVTTNGSIYMAFRNGL